MVEHATPPGTLKPATSHQRNLACQPEAGDVFAFILKSGLPLPGSRPGLAQRPRLVWRGSVYESHFLGNKKLPLVAKALAIISLFTMQVGITR